MTFTPEQVADLSADLSRANVRTRKQAGRQLSYVEGWFAEAEANRIFGHHAWDSVSLDERCVAEKPRKIGDAGVDGWSVSYVCKVRVTVTTPDGQKVVRDGVGAGHGIDRDLGLAHESAIKEAATDAEKRALKTFGNPFGLALYDKTQAHVSDAPPPPRLAVAGVMTGRQLQEAQTPPAEGRKSSAQAKRDGDDVKIKTDVASLDAAGLFDWRANFDSYTAHLPFSWLDSIQNMLELREEELKGAAAIGDQAESMDEAFRASVGPAGASGVAGNNAQRQAAA